MKHILSFLCIVAILSLFFAGSAFSLDNIQAALLVGQIGRIEDLWGKRDRIWRMYEGSLGNGGDITLLKTVPNARHARHLFTILVPQESRDSLLWRLQDRGIGVAVNYRPIHLLKYYQETFGYQKGAYPVAEHIGNSTISLPLYPSLTDEEVTFVIKVLLEEIHK